MRLLSLLLPLLVAGLEGRFFFLFLLFLLFLLLLLHRQDSLHQQYLGAFGR